MIFLTKLIAILQYLAGQFVELLSPCAGYLRSASFRINIDSDRHTLTLSHQTDFPVVKLIVIVP